MHSFRDQTLILSRKTFFHSLIGIAFMTAFGLSLSISTPLHSQQPVPQQPGPAKTGQIVVKSVRGNLYQVSGGVGNAFFYIFPEEILIIDSSRAPETATQMVAEIKKLSDKPIRRILLTHSDPDHVNGLTAFPPDATIISHSNTRLLMAQTNAKSGAVNANVNVGSGAPGAPGSGANASTAAPNAVAAPQVPLPTITFSNEMSLYIGDQEVRLLYFGPAHTSGDVVVYFPSDKVAIVGDLIFIGRDPLVHLQKNGTSFGLVGAQKSILQLDADLFLSGHSDGVDKKTIETLMTQIEEEQTKVKTLVQEGKSLEEVKKAFGVEEKAPPPGARRWPSLVEVIYRELTEKK